MIKCMYDMVEFRVLRSRIKSFPLLSRNDVMLILLLEGVPFSLELVPFVTSDSPLFQIFQLVFHFNDIHILFLLGNSSYRNGQFQLP